MKDLWESLHLSWKIGGLFGVLTNLVGLYVFWPRVEKAEFDGSAPFVPHNTWDYRLFSVTGYGLSHEEAVFFGLLLATGLGLAASLVAMAAAWLWFRVVAPERNPIKWDGAD